MQELYDEMLPGITERQAAYAEEVAAALAEVADVDAGAPVKDRDGHRAARCASSRARGVDGLLVVMLTYGPAMRVARALARDARCRSASPTSSPSRRSRPSGTWAT